MLTAYILPKEQGVALQFINQDVGSYANLPLNRISQMIDTMSCVLTNDRKIGTNLRSKIMEPLVYSKLKDLKRPLLITVMTDSIPNGEDQDEFVNTIVECGDKLEAAGMPRESKCLDRNSR